MKKRILKLRKLREKSEKKAKKFGNGKQFKDFWADWKKAKKENPDLTREEFTETRKKGKEVKEEAKPKEIKEEEKKPEVKLKETSLNKENKEMKEATDKVTDEETMEIEQPKVETEEPKEEKPETKDSDKYFWLYVIGAIGIIALGLKLLSGRSSPQVFKPEESSQSKTRKFDIGGGRIIDIPV